MRTIKQILTVLFIGFAFIAYTLINLAKRYQ